MTVPVEDPKEWVPPTESEILNRIKVLLDEWRPEAEWRAQHSKDEPASNMIHIMIGTLTKVCYPQPPVDDGIHEGYPFQDDVPVSVADHKAASQVTDVDAVLESLNSEHGSLATIGEIQGERGADAWHEEVSTSEDTSGWSGDVEAELPEDEKP